MTMNVVKTTHVKIRHAMIAGAYIATISLATIQQSVAKNIRFHARENAAVMFQSIMKYSAADMFHNIIVRLAASMSLKNIV